MAFSYPASSIGVILKSGQSWSQLVTNYYLVTAGHISFTSAYIYTQVVRRYQPGTTDRWTSILIYICIERERESKRDLKTGPGPVLSILGLKDRRTGPFKKFRTVDTLGTTHQKYGADT